MFSGGMERLCLALTWESSGKRLSWGCTCLVQRRERWPHGGEVQAHDRGQWRLSPGSAYEPCGSQQDRASSKALPPEEPLEG